MRQRRCGGFHRAHRQLADVVAAHVFDGLRLEHPHTGELATAQQHAQEPQVVGPGAVQAATTHEELRRLWDLEWNRR